MPVTEIGNSGVSTPPADMIISRSEVTSKADFLKMLIAQLTHQDPLSPMEGTDFASQLAQFSSLEELQKMTGYLGNSLEANLLLATSINNSMATTLIGKTIRAEAETVSLGESGDVQIDFELESAATEISIEIVDESGMTIRTLTISNLPEGQNDIQWDGYDEDGNRAAAGDYTVRVTATNSDGENVGANLILEGRVTGVTYRDGIAILMVGSREVHMGDIIAVMDENPEIIPIG